MSGVLGVGVDILRVDTIAPSVARPDDPCVRRIDSPAEQALIRGRDIPLYSYATRFAGKEAVFKAFGVDGDAFRLNEIEILETDFGQPVVTLRGKAAALAAEKGISSVLLSLSYDTDYAVAYATALGEAPAPR